MLLSRLVDSVSLIDFKVELVSVIVTLSVLVKLVAGLFASVVVLFKSVAVLLFSVVAVLLFSDVAVLLFSDVAVLFSCSIFSRVELTAARTVGEGGVS